MEGEIKNYKDLIVWQKSHAASANIAEGFGSYSNKEYRRYLNIALKSAHESDNWIQVFKDSKKITNGLQNGNLEKIEKLYIENIKMLISLMKKMDVR